MKKNKLINIFLVFIIIVFAAAIYFLLVYKKPQTQKEQTLIGGQKDEHGCLIPAGYSWCELKQKCLRVWEEKCETPSSDTTSNWLTYTDTKYNFELKMPTSWQGYRATQGDYPSYSYTGFSFGSPHQGFEIFKIVTYSKQQWDAISNKSLFTVVYQDSTKTQACDGCCTQAGDKTGGGQFDEFQTQRCQEVPEILKTFKTVN